MKRPRKPMFPGAGTSPFGPMSDGGAAPAVIGRPKQFRVTALRAFENSRGVSGAEPGQLPTNVGKSGRKVFLPGLGPSGQAVAFQPVHRPRQRQFNREALKL